MIFRVIVGACLLAAAVLAGQHFGVDWAWVERLALLLRSIPLRVYVGVTFIPIPAYITWAMCKADRGDASTFKFIHLITTDKGRGSNKEVLFLVAGVTSIWGIWALIVLDRITEWYLAGVLITFAGSAWAARYTTMKARQAGVSEPPPNAGDDPEVPPPAMERTTTVNQQTTERTAAPADQLAKSAKKGGMG